MRTTTNMPCVGKSHKRREASDFSVASREICSAELPRTEARAADAGGMLFLNSVAA